MQSCTSTNSTSVTARPVSSRISRRKASTEGSPHLTLPPGMPQRFDHLCVRTISTWPAPLKIRPPQHPAQLPQVFYDQIRLRRAQLLQRVVARQHRARVNAPVPRSVNVVLHIPDEQCFVRDQSVLFQDFVNLLALVPDVHIRLVEIRAEAGDSRLNGEVVAVDGAQQECAQLARAAEFQELKRMGQRTDRGLHLPEPAVKPSLQLRQRNVRHVAVVEDREGQAKLGAELLQAHLRPLGLRQNVVGRLPNSGQVVHERSRPVEDNVPNHRPSVAVFLIPATAGSLQTSKRQGSFAPGLGLWASAFSLRIGLPRRLPFLRLPLEFIAQFPPKLPWVFRP